MIGLALASPKLKLLLSATHPCQGARQELSIIFQARTVPFFRCYLILLPIPCEEMNKIFRSQGLFLSNIKSQEEKNLKRSL